MPGKYLEIEDIMVPESSAQWTTYEGVESSTLIEINAEAYVASPTIATRVRGLADDKTRVAVKDPVAAREYQAKVTVTMSRRQGDEETLYLRIREVELFPEFTHILIDGEKFEVLKYRQRKQDGFVYREAVLKLRADQTAVFQAIEEKDGTVAFQREGVDDRPVELVIGGDMRWSEHEDGKERYVKQVIRLHDPARPAGRGLNFPFNNTQNQLAAMVLALQTKLVALTDALGSSGTIPAEFADRLRNQSTWLKSEVSAGEKAIFVRNLHRVTDAMNEVDDSD